MKESQSDAIDLDGPYAQLQNEIDPVRADRMRDLGIRLRARSEHLCEQADIACAEARALISTFQTATTGKVTEPDGRSTVR